MAEKKTKEKSEAPEVKEAPLEQLVLDQTDGKYGYVPLAAIWARELKRQQEFSALSTAQLLDAALKDVLTGKVTWETVEKLPKTDAEAEARKKK